MKKLIICAAIVFAAGIMTSCNKDTNRCWEMTYSTSIAGVEIKVNNYIWGTQNELDAAIADVKAELGEDIKITYKRTSKAESECHD